MLDWLQTPGGSRAVWLHWGGGTTSTAAPGRLQAEERRDCSCVDKPAPQTKGNKKQRERKCCNLLTMCFDSLPLSNGRLRRLKWAVIRRQAR